MSEFNHLREITESARPYAARKAEWDRHNNTGRRKMIAIFGIEIDAIWMLYATIAGGLIAFFGILIAMNRGWF